MIDRNHKELLMLEQCQLLGISRSGLYYKPADNEKDLLLMKLIDKQ
ncbi:MAG: hypothetical protein WCG14_04595 [Chlamydiia bacterium]